MLYLSTRILSSANFIGVTRINTMSLTPPPANFTLVQFTMCRPPGIPIEGHVYKKRLLKMWTANEVKATFKAWLGGDNFEIAVGVGADDTWYEWADFPWPDGKTAATEYWVIEKGAWFLTTLRCQTFLRLGMN
jgi:hypothetical protein